VERSPSLHAAPVSRLPVREFGENDQPEFKIEAEHGFIFKQNGNGVVGINFNALDRFAFDLGKLEELPCTFLARVCTLRSSHRSPFPKKVICGQGRVRATTRARPVLFVYPISWSNATKKKRKMKKRILLSGFLPWAPGFFILGHPNIIASIN